ncbi:MAG: tetratricopeptide repeat protein [Muribaculaceae bacterium]|nr:tetratricopeptide repeat protein [Muribaculaceae bacterium]
MKKNTAASRNYSAFITRYNIYYNGDKHYKETLQEMEKNYEDDYTRLLYAHPADARENPKAPQPQGDFTRSIEKAQKAIQLRSIKKRPARKPGKSQSAEYKAWLKRDEYNPFIHNAWMMMGRSQYMNGDFLGAASTFFYVSKHFTWLPQTVTEAKLWQARSYCSMDWLFETEAIVSRIKPDELTNNTLKELYNVTYGDFYVKSGKYAEAVPYLHEAARLSSGTQQTRLYFLLGQALSRSGDRKGAYEAYKKAGSSNSASYRTKFNARIKQSEVFDGTDIKKEVDALRRMTRYGRNKEYLDQIYYAIGNLYLSRRDTAQAIANYELAVEKSTRSGIDKAMAQLTLGGLYFDRHQYEKAQPCYAEAVAQIPDDYPDYKLIKRRSDVLDELAIYSQNVTLQDSLLRLSQLPLEEQEKIIRKIIKELEEKEKKEAEEARREEYLANQAAAGTGLQNSSSASAPNSFVLNSDNSWYFYNAATRNAGKTEFQRRWGSRKLEDNWRRRNKSSFDMSDFESGGEEEESESGEDISQPNDTLSPEERKRQSELEANENDPHKVEYYLKQIPKTEVERATANEVIQEGLYNMGVILKDKLEDFPAAITEFDRLLSRYPDNVYRLDVYYNLYLMYVRSGNTAMAEHYRKLIVDQFPESLYGQAMRDPDYIENLKVMEQRQEQLYEQAYEDYLANRNEEVHKAYATMSELYPTSELMPKFMFLDALAYVTENRPDEFRERLKLMLERYPETDMTPIASNYLRELARGRKLQSGAVNSRGMLWDIRLGNDSVMSTDELSFDLNPETEQYYVLLFPTDRVNANELLFSVARHNFTSFAIKDFDLEQMNFGRLGLLIVKGFDNLNQLNAYKKVMADSESWQMPRGVQPVIISKDDFEKLIREGRSFDDYFRYAEDKLYDAVEESVIDFEDEQPAPVEVIEEPAQEKEPEAEQPVRSVRPAAPDVTVKADSTVTAPKSELQPVAPPKQDAPKSELQPVAPPKQAVPAPVAKPVVPAPAPKPKQQPQTILPYYPPGSEGDDDDLL